MIWDEAKQDHELLSFYRKLIHLRKRYRALRDGSFEFLPLCCEQVIGYRRKWKEEEFIILLNAGGEEEEISLNIDRSYVVDEWCEEKLSVHQGELSVKLNEYGSVILRLQN